MRGNVIAVLSNWFKPLNPLSATPRYAPRFGSPAINSGDCLVRTTTEFPNPLVTIARLGTPRPQGGACDVGAIEADYVFAGDFD